MSCSACCRGFLSFLIILNMILGLAIVGATVWLYLDGAELWEYLYGFNIGPLLNEVEHFHYLLYSLLALGAIKVFMSFVGCCEVSRKFFIAVVLVLGIQVAAGTCMWYFRDDFDQKSAQTLSLFVRDRYHVVNTTAGFDSDAALDDLQSVYQCCGSVAPSDWSTSFYSDLANEVGTYKVPESCCIPPKGAECETARTIQQNFIPGGTIYNKGCSTELFKPVMKYIYRYETLGVLVGYVVFEFLVMTLRLFACRKRYGDYDSEIMELKPYR